MANLRDIKRRIRSVRNTRQITKAMKLVAAAKLRRNQGRLLSLRPYSDMVAGLIRYLLPQVLGDEHPLLKKVEPSRICLVVVTGDRGLCGSFNHNILRAAEKFLDENSRKDIRLIAVGKKGYRHFLKKGWKPSEKHFDILDGLTYSRAARLSDDLIDLYVKDKIHALYYIYNEFVSQIQQKLRVTQVLPFETAHLERRSKGLIREESSADTFKTWSEKDRENYDVYIIEPRLESFCSELLLKYMSTELFRVLLETLSSEYAARMTAMDNATDNAGDMIEALTLAYNRARQAAITKELSDIVGGAEAMK